MIRVHQAAYLKKRRIALDMTQRELAEKVGVHIQYVSNWECGKCGPPSAKFKKVVSVLKLKFGDLSRAILSDCREDIFVAWGFM